MAFRTLFGLDKWAVTSMTMTSLVRFASKLPSSHQTILPSCLSPGVKGLLQCRLKGTVTATQSGKAFDEQCWRKLTKLISRSTAKKDLFGGCKETPIAAGSYLVTMPTTEGRSALVIFPPGRQSIEDVKFMLGDQPTDSVHVMQLQRVALASCGAQGCRMFSTEFKDW